MVTIAHRHADEYVQNPQRSHHIFLVHGTDAGLVSERSRALLKPTPELFLYQVNPSACQATLSPPIRMRFWMKFIR